MGVSNFVKYVTICAIFGVTLISFFYNFYYNDTKTIDPSFLLTNITYIYNNNTSTISTDLKYLLLWSNHYDPIKTMREGQITFIQRRCSFTNCYVSTNRSLLGDVAHFDAIVFHGRELPKDTSQLPQLRSPHQKYIYINMESSARFPVCNKIYNHSYFNWSLTYRLNSDEYFGYIIIRDKQGNIIGPKEEMHWEKVEAMIPIDDTLKAKLSTKKIAAAWFVSNCYAPSGRDQIAKNLQMELEKYGMQVDIFGRCGKKKCPKDSMEECLRILETDYYFYLSFENSFAEDYVTEKLLHALKSNAIPVVLGGANYTRFMPDGIYLTAQQSGIRELAKQMVDIINDKQKYYKFFKWQNHYSYHDLDESSSTNRYCKLCELMNNKEKILEKSVYEDFSEWVKPPYKCW